VTSNAPRSNHGAPHMSTASLGSQWVPRQRPANKSPGKAKRQLIVRIRRDAQTREPPPITLPRLAFTETPIGKATQPSPVEPEEIDPRWEPRACGNPSKMINKPDRRPSKMINKPDRRDARPPYSTKQLHQMDRKFRRAMERALRKRDHTK
jgi:hypothetical protein